MPSLKMGLVMLEIALNEKVMHFIYGIRIWNIVSFAILPLGTSFAKSMHFDFIYPDMHPKKK